MMSLVILVGMYALACLVIGVVIRLVWDQVIKKTVVQSGTTGLLYRDGKLQRELAPGYYRWIDLGGRTALWTLPNGPVTLQAIEHNLLSKDQFSFRMTMVPIVRITDARAYVEHLAGLDTHFTKIGIHFPALHAAASAAVLQRVAQQTLNEFLADPLSGLAMLAAELALAVPGAVIEDILVTAITMPPEVRKMFTEVERAKREGLAALERARGETASLRALANAARSLQGNPQLAHLRILQAVEATKGAKTFVLGGLDPLTVAGASPQPPVSE